MATREEKDAEAWARWQQPISQAIEVLLLNNRAEIGVDPDYGELAYCYEQVAGWTVEEEDPLPPSPIDPETAPIVVGHLAGQITMLNSSPQTAELYRTRRRWWRR